jgi:hypothetical protein
VGWTVTSFFIPGYEKDQAAAEDFYEGLRAQAGDQTGAVAHDRRIESMLCRREGVDRTIAVGDRDAIEGETILAILQVGREGFTIHTKATANGGGQRTIEMGRRSVYSVSDFDA